MAGRSRRTAVQCKAGLFAPVGDSGFRMSERKVSAPAPGAEHLADVLAPFSVGAPCITGTAWTATQLSSGAAA